MLETILMITPSGLRIRTIEGSKARETQIDWVDNRTPDWITEDWDPSPVVRAQAVTNDVEAVIVGMASLLALGIRLNNRSYWYVISASPQAGAATTLARSMGLGDADNVGFFTDPKQITLSTVSNATDKSLSVTQWGQWGQPQGAISRTSPWTL